MARRFNTDDRIDVSPDASIDDLFDGGGSISAMIDPISAGGAGQGAIFRIDTSFILQLQDFSGNLGRIAFYKFFTGSFAQWQTSTRPIELLKDSSITIDYNADSVANNPTFWINGVPLTVGSGITEITTPVGTRISGAGLTKLIGNRGSGGRRFDGNLWNIGSWTTTLSDSQHLSYSEGRVPSHLINTENLGASLPLWGNQDPEPDYSGNGNTGALVDAPIRAKSFNVQLSENFY